MNAHKSTESPWSARRGSYSAFAAALLLSAVRAGAGLITFETTPSGAIPVDNSPISAPYVIDGGGDVQFFFDTNANGVFDSGIDTLPNFERSGDDPDNAFTSNFTGIHDTARPGFEGQLGDFFLSVPTGVSNSTPLMIRYNTLQTIRALSGEIWDIDGIPAGNEQWQVDVLGPLNLVLQTVYSPIGVDATPSSLDSLPWNFSFTNLPDGVEALRITFIGTKPGAPGWAFNNLAEEAIPEPGTALFGLALAGLCACGRRRFRTATSATPA